MYFPWVTCTASKANAIYCVDCIHKYIKASRAHNLFKETLSTWAVEDATALTTTIQHIWRTHIRLCMTCWWWPRHPQILLRSLKEQHLLAGEHREPSPFTCSSPSPQPPAADAQAPTEAGADNVGNVPPIVKHSQAKWSALHIVHHHAQAYTAQAFEINSTQKSWFWECSEHDHCSKAFLIWDSIAFSKVSLKCYICEMWDTALIWWFCVDLFDPVTGLQTCIIRPESCLIIAAPFLWWLHKN